MTYTVHLGRLREAWPEQIAARPTRGEAQALARTELLAAPDGGDGFKAQVRCEGRLFDTYGRPRTQKGSLGEVRHVYEYKQRTMQRTLLEAR
jgi:hypothetical protein